jgi:plastocyanin
VIADLPPHPAPAPAAARTVAVTDTAVSPTALVVAPGTAVTWQNVGRRRHTVSEDAGRFDSGSMVPGERFRISAPADPGVYSYHCRFHAFIRGTVTVSLVALETPRPVRAGGRPVLAGTVPGAAPGTIVRLQRRVPGAWEDAATATTDAEGGFRSTGPPLAARTAFRAVAGGAVSPSVRAQALPAVTVGRRGDRLWASVRPVPRGGRAHLQRLDLDRYVWRHAATRGLRAGRASFRLPVPGPYRIAVDAAGGLSATTSRVVEFRPAAYRD